MPLNTLRLNHAPSSHPNERIVFIKPLPRPPSEQHLFETADAFLRAIAAQCLPIMKSNYLSVTTLEEYEPNPEFIGRNFNNGEIIQLVLQGKNGGWVPFNMVQMVMMHELAHNLHMNHSKCFWETRNQFAGELRQLWSKGYTGEGFWGSGTVLGNLRKVVGNNSMTESDMQEIQVCGGMFRSRRRKRKRGGVDGTQQLTWKEKRDRRIEKKFGKNGQMLGEDEDRRMFLEIGKKGVMGGKPRVAQSKRGRELRAAAALARFETNKVEVEQVKKHEESEESEEEYEEDLTIKGEEARDIDGQRLLDSMGFGMVRVCDEEDADDIHVKQEMAELGEVTRQRESRSTSRNDSDVGVDGLHQTRRASNHNPLYDIPEYKGSPSPPPSPAKSASHATPKPKPKITITRLPSSTGEQASSSSTQPRSNPPNSKQSDIRLIPSTTSCPICSLSNSSLAATCAACSHVLDPAKDPRHWKCQSVVCVGSEYVNGGDAGVCGVCGEGKGGG